ncbi:translation initiation factor eIF5A [Coemansia sp. RSA 2337]|nr:translation initiation factor eIF5A [Coemansia sp. S3946]KAJ2073507.1 translation initiation factor eIF5A [Coemansia sp. S155-1]KAJ2468714.1 translation initiation factor eIF5A [Coemansia sp. RSA 2337]
MSKNTQNKHDSEVVDAEVPQEEVVATTEDVVATTEDVVASTEDVVASTEDVVASTEDAVSESKEKQSKTAKASPSKGKAAKGKASKDDAPAPNKNNDAQFDQEIESAGSGASLTFPMQCSALRINGHVVLNGRPCKIVAMTTSKTGKHGHAKVSLTGIDIFTGRKIEDMSPSTHNMDVPNIKREEFTLLDVDNDGEFLSLVTPEGDTKDDVKVPEGELGEKMLEDFKEGKDLLVTVITSMDEEAAISYKEAPKNKD